MKKKIFFAMVCAIWLCIILACGGGFDATTDARTMTAAENLDTGVTESEQQFFKNQEKSLKLLDEAMSPFRKESDKTSARSQLYDESFAGVFIDENGNLNIGVVQGAVTEQTKKSMNSLRGQVIYRQDAFSYNFLASKLGSDFESDG
jgi:hypothetical protein